MGDTANYRSLMITNFSGMCGESLLSKVVFAIAQCNLANTSVLLYSISSIGGLKLKEITRELFAYRSYLQLRGRIHCNYNSVVLTLVIGTS